MTDTTETIEPLARSRDEGEAPWFFGELAVILADGEHTGGHFALVEHTGPNGMSPPWHVQPDSDETFYVLEGEMTFWAGDPTEPVRRGGPDTVVSVPRGTPHSFRVESETARFLSYHTPAGHENFYRAAGDPAPQRTLPLLSEPDIPRADAAGREHGVEFLGPPPGAPGAH